MPSHLPSAPARLLAALLLAAAVGLVGAAPDEGQPPEPETPPEYGLFVEDGRGALFLRTAARAFASTLLGREILPSAPSPGVKRPAGPRDEPPPPRWPREPVGVVLCVRTADGIRGCEGDLAPPFRSLSRLATALGERLAATTSRGGGPVLEEGEIPEARLEGWFALPLDEMDYGELKATLKAGELDPGRVGFLVTGSRGRVFVAPGEAGSARQVARIARKGGAFGLFRRPGTVVIFRPVPAAEPLALSP